MVQTLTCRDGQKAVGLFLRRLCLFTLLFRCNLGGIANQTLVMFLAHVVYFHAGQRTQTKALLNCKTGIVGMNMYFNDFVRCDADNRVAD